MEDEESLADLVARINQEQGGDYQEGERIVLWLHRMLSETLTGLVSRTELLMENWVMMK